MSEPRTPQVPMMDKHGDPFYPLTQYNQIVMPDGSRWNAKTSAKDVGALPEDGTAADSYKLGGKEPSEYAPASDLEFRLGFPDYASRTTLVQDTPDVASDTEFSMTMVDDGFIQCRGDSSSVAASIFLRCKINNRLIYDFTNGTKDEKYQYRMTPLFPVKKGDVVAATIGIYQNITTAVAGGVRTVYFYPIRVGG